MKFKKKEMLKVLSVILTIAMMVTVIPQISFADSNAEIINDSDIICEAVEFRDEYSKSFLKGDGTYTAISNGIALHYKDENDTWQDIDNTIVTETNEKGEDIYTNTSGAFTIELPSSLDNNKEVTLEKNNYRVSFKLLENVKKNKAKVKNNKEPKLNKEDRKLAKNLAKIEKKASNIQYSNVLENTDIIYDIQPDGLKESIILSKRPQKKASYTYEISTEGLSAKLCDGNIIKFYAPDKDDPEFVMPAPFMFDNSDEPVYSHNITVTLKKLSIGKYKMIYTPDTDWLQSEKRQYPVTIDPTIKTNPNNSAISFAYINHYFPNQNFTGQLFDLTNYTRLYLKINCFDLSGDEIITKAALHLPSLSVSGDPKIISQQAAEEWDPNTITANNSALYHGYNSRSLSDIRTVQKGSCINNATYTTFDITSMMNNWQINPSYNYGMRLEIFRENTSGSVKFITQHMPEYNAYPFVTLDFTKISGIDSRYDYHTVDVGRAGTVYINDFTGKVSLLRQDMKFDGNVMPVDFTMLYDTSRKINNSGYANGYSNGKYMYAPYDYRFDRKGTTVYELIDSLGASHLFNLKDRTAIEGSPDRSLIKSENSDYEINIKNVSSDYSDIDIASLIIKTPEGYEISYPDLTDRYIKTITNPNQPGRPNIKITKDSDNYCITDGAGRRYVMVYENKLLKYLRYYGTGDTVLETVTYSYIKEGSNYILRTVTYPDGQSILYTNGGDYFYSITDVGGYTIKLDQMSHNGRLYYISETAWDETEGDYLSIKYHFLHTEFIGRSGIREYKNFNNAGQVIQSVNEDGYSIFNKYDTGDNRGQLLASSQLTGTGEGNLLSNPYFIEVQNSKPVGYSFNSKLTSVNSKLNNNIIGYARFTPNYLSENFVEQSLNIAGKKGETYSFGGWIECETVNPVSSEEGDTSLEAGRKYGMEAYIEPKTGEAGEPMTFSLDFNSYNTFDWQYMQDEFTLPYDVDKITVRYVLDYQYGTINISGIGLYKEATFYGVDTNGNISALPDPNYTPTSDESEDSTEEESNDVKDSYGRLLSTVSPEGVGSFYTYDDWGNVLTSGTKKDPVIIKESSTYTSTGNYQTAHTDALDNTTNYTYNESLGTLQSLTDAKGNITNYSYDSLQRLTGMSLNVSGLEGGTKLSNNYSYTRDDLRVITSGSGTTYNIDYNIWGNLNSIKIGNHSLVNYSYQNNIDKLLNAINFGNNQKQRFSYNAKGQITGLSYDNETESRFNYTYNKSGELTEKVDVLRGIKTVYKDDIVEEYNSTGALLHSYVQNGNNFIEKVNGKIFTTKYGEGTEGSPLTDYEYASGKTALRENKSDDLGRIKSDSLTVKTSSTKNYVIKRDYYYSESAGKNFSGQISGLSYIFGQQSQSYSKSLSYTYDENGNIKTISQNGILLQSYTYDEAGQLTREDNKTSGKTTVFKYNTGGNIVSKTEYEYTTGELGSAVSVIPYSYSDNNWRDKLTSYNGKAITYDNIGNPLTYDGWSYVWEGGRQLKRMSKDGSVIDYKYDDGGIRTQKTVNGAVTNYTLINGRITAQETNGEWIYFRYDENDSLISLNQNGTEYFYVLNIQGDIIGIVDENGKLVVEYEYDAWGAPLGVTGELAETLGAANPFRYRGYYWDGETGLYCTATRYYNPEWGRFINADAPESMLLQGDSNILATNLFAYCFNNPVMNADHSGMVVTPANVIGAIIGGIIGAVGGYFLTRWMADRIGLKGWKRTVFIVGLTAVITAAAAVIGYFIGPHVAKAGKSIIKALRTLGKTYCFVEGTPVLAEHGNVPIEQIKAGDYVYSENPDTGEKGLKQVLQTFVNEAYELIHVSVNDETIVTTPGHPFYVPEKGWVGADKLEAGDIVVLENGNHAKVEEVHHESLSIPVKVYNFEVEDFHTYYVGDSSVLVHNTGCIKDFLKSPKKFKDVAKLLKDNGFEQVRQEGSHVIFKDILTGKTFPVPNHGGKEIAIGTLRSILKLAGLL